MAHEIKWVCDGCGAVGASDNEGDMPPGWRYVEIEILTRSNEESPAATLLSGNFDMCDPCQNRLANVADPRLPHSWPKR